MSAGSHINLKYVNKEYTTYQNNYIKRSMSFSSIYKCIFTHDEQIVCI